MGLAWGASPPRFALSVSTGAAAEEHMGLAGGGAAAGGRQGSCSSLLSPLLRRNSRQLWARPMISDADTLHGPSTSHGR